MYPTYGGGDTGGGGGREQHHFSLINKAWAYM